MAKILTVSSKIQQPSVLAIRLKIFADGSGLCQDREFSELNLFAQRMSFSSLSLSAYSRVTLSCWTFFGELKGVRKGYQDVEYILKNKQASRENFVDLINKYNWTSWIHPLIPVSDVRSFFVIDFHLKNLNHEMQISFYRTSSLLGGKVTFLTEGGISQRISAQNKKNLSCKRIATHSICLE